MLHAQAFDHRSLEGILLIVQCKHAALSHCHSNDVTSVYRHMHPSSPSGRLRLRASAPRQRSRPETRMIERRKRRCQRKKLPVQSGMTRVTDYIRSSQCTFLLFFGLPLHWELALPTDPSPILRFALAVGVETGDKRICTGFCIGSWS